MRAELEGHVALGATLGEGMYCSQALPRDLWVLFGGQGSCCRLSSAPPVPWHGKGRGEWGRQEVWRGVRAERWAGGVD